MTFLINNKICLNIFLNIFLNALSLKLINLTINYNMLFWIIKIILFSIIFILLVHNVLNFLLETLTISKKKDMNQITSQNYKNIYDILLQNNNDILLQNNNDILLQNNNNNILQKSQRMETNLTYIDTLPNVINEEKEYNNEDSMKNELVNYLRDQLNSNVN